MRASCRASSVLPTPVGPANRKLPIGLSGGAQARPRQLDRRRDLVDRGVLAEDHPLQLGVERLQRAAVVARHRLHRHARHLGDDRFDLLRADRLGPLLRRQQLLRRAGLVEHVDRLVGQVQVLQVLRRQRHGRLERLVGVDDAVMHLVVRAQPPQDLERLGLGRLEHVDLLEPARQRAILVERLLDVVERRRADAAQRAVRQRRLEQVAGVHRAARRRAGADERVDLVDEEDRVLFLLQPLEHLLDALLEVAAVARAGDERAEVERVDLRRPQHVGHLPFVNAQRQPLGQRGLADARLADEQRVVLAAAAQHLDHPLELERAADQRIDLARRGARHQVGGKRLERIGCGGGALLAANGRRRRIALRRHARSRAAASADRAPAMRRKYAAWLSSSWSMKTSRLPLSTCFALETAACTIACWMTRSKPSVGSGSTVAGAGTGVNARDEHVVQLPAERVQIHAAGREDAARLRLLGDRQQQVLEADRVVAAVGRQPERALDASPASRARTERGSCS